MINNFIIKAKKRARHLELTNELTRDTLPVLLAVYSTSAGPGVRHSCIQVGQSGYKQGCQMAKFDPSLSLDCARVEGVGAHSKERKGSNFAA